jgi:hypothetical protein
MNRREVLLFLAIGLLALPAVAGDTATAAGVWNATAVNGHSLPGSSFTRADAGRECSQETVSSTLLLDSAGNWSALMTSRNRCKGEPAPKKGSEQSALVVGTFQVSGESLVLINGTGDYAGQTATFTFKRGRR